MTPDLTPGERNAICLEVAVEFIRAGKVPYPGEGTVGYGAGEVEMLDEQDRRIQAAEAATRQLHFF